MDLVELERMLIPESEWETTILELPTAVVKAVAKTDDNIIIYAFRLLSPHMWALVYSAEVGDNPSSTVIDLIASAITMATADWIDQPKKASRSKSYQGLSVEPPF
jgi:hypothetical protein